MKKTIKDVSVQEYPRVQLGLIVPKRSRDDKVVDCICCGVESAILCLLLCLLQLLLRSNEATNPDNSAAAHAGDIIFLSPQRQ